MERPATENKFQVRHAQRLLTSFERFVGRPLLAGCLTPEEAARDLFKAPFIVVSHDRQPDPVLNYGNEAALKLWETDWDQLTKLPSHKTAEPVNRDARARIFEIVERDGYIDGYSGVRISTNGQRFQIIDTIVWLVMDEADVVVGEAATFENVKFL